MDQNQLEEWQRLQQQIQALENLIKQHLTKEAIARYYNVKAAHPEKAVQVLTILAKFMETNKVQEKITDEQFKKLLQQLQEKKEFRIIRK